MEKHIFEKNISCKKLPCSDSFDRCFHSSTLYKHYLITYAGLPKRAPITVNDIKILNLKTYSFEEFNFEGPEPIPRTGHSACLFDSNKILIFGGSEFAKLLNDPFIITIEETSPLTLKYEKVQTHGGANFKRTGHSANIYNNKMYIFGGIYVFHPQETSNELWSLDLDTFIWEKCETTGNQPEARMNHIATLYNDKLYIFGGISESLAAFTNCYTLSFENMEWKEFKIQGAPLLQLAETSSFVIGEDLYIINGYFRFQLEKNVIQIFNLPTNTLYHSEFQGEYVPVVAGTTTAYEDRIILWGGLKNPQEALYNLFSLQFHQEDDLEYEGENDSFSSYVEPLYHSQEHADIHFLVEGHHIPAHKLVLSLRCKFFANLFKSGMKESNSQTIEISDIKLNAFKALLRFLYLNKVKFNEKLALDLYEVADKYMQKDLKNVCEKYLSKNVRLANLITMVDFIEKFRADSLKETVLVFIMNNLQEIKKAQNDFPIPYSYMLEVALRLQTMLTVNVAQQ